MASFDLKLSYHKEDSAYERILYEMAGNEADCKHPSDKGENDMETVRLGKQESSQIRMDSVRFRCSESAMRRP